MFKQNIRSLAFIALLSLVVSNPSVEAAVSYFDDEIVINDTTLSPGLQLDVAGNIGATQFCDAAGNNCTLAGDLGGGLWNEGAGANEINYTAGNVGIGIGNPIVGLDVSGEMRIDASSASWDIWLQGGTGSGNSRNLALLGADEDSGDYLFINYNNEYANGVRMPGRVGIGSNFAPSQTLHVRDDQANPTLVAIQNSSGSTGTNTSAGVNIATNGNTMSLVSYSAGATGTLGGVNRADGAFLRTTTGAPASSLNVGTGSAVPLNFFTGDATRMTIDGATGYVGIGTTTPTGGLEIVSDNAGNDAADDLVISTFDNTGAFDPGLILKNARGTKAAPTASQTGDELGGVVMFGHNGTDYQIGGHILGRMRSNWAVNPSMDLIFTTKGTGEALHSGKMIITGSGEVGIGTTTPAENLTVNGTLLSTPILYTANQDQPYIIAGTPNYTGASTNWGTFGFQHRIKTNAGGSPRITVDAPSGGEVFSILNGGDVGIGDSTPDGTLKLDVEGRVGATEYCDENGANCTLASELGSGYWTLSGTNDVYYNGGEVGIGISNPTEELVVNENQNAPTTIAVQNSSSGTGTNTRAGITVQANAGTADFVQFGSNAGGSWGGQTQADGTFLRTYTGSPTSKLVVGTGTNTPLHFVTNAATQMTLAGNGSLGIGTSSPGTKLDVDGVIRLNDRLEFDGVVDAGVEATRVGTVDTLLLTANDNLEFETGGTTKAIVTGGGNMGIGTASPNRRLHVEGGDMRINDGGNGSVRFGTGNQYIYGDGGSALYFNAQNSTSTQMIFRDAESAVYGRIYGDGNGANFGLLDGDGNWGLQLNKDNYTAFRINNLERMRILANGNVGIGKTNPGTALDMVGQIRTTSHVEAGNGTGGVALTVNDSQGNANVTFNHVGGTPDVTGNAARIEVNSDATTNARMYFELGSGVTAGVNTSLNSVMTLHANQNVGIGTNDPVESIDISKPAANIKLTDTNTGADNFILTNSSVGGMILAADENNEVAGSYLDLFVDGTRQVRVTETGDVGIGDPSPDAALKLDVEGPIGATQYCDQNGANCTLAGDLGGGLWNEGAGANEINYTAGNVGIGVSDPVRSLHVGGAGMILDHSSASYDLWLQGGTTSSGDTRNLALLGVTSGDYLGINWSGEYTGGTRVISNMAVGSNFTPTEELHTRVDQANPTSVVAQNASASTGTNTSAGFTAASNGTSLRMETFSAGATGTLGGANRADGAFIRNASSAPASSMNIGTGAAVPLRFFTTDATRMTITGAGDVGIGTTSPAQKFSVAGNLGISEPGLNGQRLIISSSGSGAIINQNDNSSIILQTQGVERMRVRHSGHVGIGTSNPTEALVVRAVDAADDSSGIRNIAYRPHLTLEDLSTNANDWQIWSDQGDLSFLYGDASDGVSKLGSTAMVMDATNGNIGFGTAAPSEVLHIHSSNPSLRMVDTNTGADAYITANSGVGGVAIQADQNNEVAGSYIDFFTDGTRHVRITDTGDFGIGDVTPDGSLKLDVNGNIGANNYCDGAGNNCIAAAALGNGDNLGNHTATAVLNMDDRQIRNLRELQGKDWDDNTGGTDNKYRVLYRDGAHMFYDGGVAIGGYGNGTWTDLASGRLIVQDRVGVGITNPGEELHVRSDQASPTSIVAQNGSAAADTDVQAMLAAQSNGNAIQMISFGTGATGVMGGQNRADAAVIRTISGAPVSQMSIGNGASAPLHLFTGDTTRMTVAANGNVGIGETVPLQRLHVEGNIRMDGSRFYFGGGDTGDFFDYATQQGMTYHENGNPIWRLTGNGANFINGGNVGIGDTTPSAKLDVSGNIHADLYGRRTHSSGFLVGGYNNVGVSSTNTNPIFTIGTNYLPTDTTLGNMYGIGYTSGGSAPFVTGTGSGWGMYVASDGDARTFLTGQANQNSYINAGGGNVGINTDTPTHRLHVAGQARIPEVILAPNNNGASDKSSILGGSGAVQIYADTVVDFYESDLNTREFRMNLGNGNFDATGVVTGETALRFPGGANNGLRTISGTVRCDPGLVMVGFNASGLLCESPEIEYN